MLTRAQLGAIGFAISRARAHTRPGAPQTAEQGVGQAEDATRREALNELHIVADCIEAAHPFGVDVTLQHLQKARDLLSKGAHK